MTFFRYFPRKEAVVEYDEYDPMLEKLIIGRPADEPALTVLHHAIRKGVQAVVGAERDALLQRTQLILDNPALRSRNILAQEETRDLFARALARRAGLAEPDLTCVVQASAALGAVAPAITAWAQADDAGLEEMIDVAFTALMTGIAPLNGGPQS